MEDEHADGAMPPQLLTRLLIVCSRLLEFAFILVVRAAGVEPTVGFWNSTRKNAANTHG